MARADAQSSSSAPPLPEKPTPAGQNMETAPSPYPFGLRNATASYAYAYAAAHEHPSERRQRFTLDLSTHSDSSDEDEAWPGVDFSELHNPGALRQFLAASDYCLGYSDSDDEGTYDPSRECFHVGLGMPTAGEEEERTGNHSPPRAGARDATPPRLVAPAARNENPVRGGHRRPDLEQLRELQAKVEQDRLLLQQLRDTLEQEQRGRGEGGGARGRARDVHHRINNNEGGEPPPIFNRASQNVAAAAMLVRAMPEPSTTEGRRVRGELRDLLETAAVQQAESSASRRRGGTSEPRPSSPLT